MTNIYTISVGKPQETLWETWCRWDDDVKMNLREVYCGDVNWIQVTQW